MGSFEAQRFSRSQRPTQIEFLRSFVQARRQGGRKGRPPEPRTTHKNGLKIAKKLQI